MGLSMSALSALRSDAASLPPSALEAVGRRKIFLSPSRATENSDDKLLPGLCALVREPLWRAPFACQLRRGGPLRLPNPTA